MQTRTAQPLQPPAAGRAMQPHPRLPRPVPLTAIAAAWAMLSLLGGCAGWHTRAPQVPDVAGVEVPAAWSLAPSAPAASAPAGALAAWIGFDDAQIGGLVADALAHNQDLAAAAANLERARALLRLAAAAVQPSVDATASAGRARSAPPLPAADLVRLGFDASWEADLWGRIAHDVAAARADTEASAATLEAARLSVAGETVLACLQLRGTQARLALAKANLQSQQETAQIARWRSQAGLASSLEVAQAETAAAQTRSQIPALEGSAAQSRHALALLSGRAPAALDDALSAPRALPTPPAGLSLQLPAAVLRQRDDVHAAEAQLRAAAARVAKADAGERPRLNLSATLAWSALTLGGLGSNPAAWSMLAGASQPLADGGALRAQSDAQRSAFDAARAAYAGVVLGALRDVEDALAARAAAQDRLQALTEAEGAARLAATLATQRYASGIVDFQTVLDTQRTLLSVQDSTAAARTDWVSSHVRLVKALGGAPAVASAEKTS